MKQRAFSELREFLLHNGGITTDEMEEILEIVNIEKETLSDHIHQDEYERGVIEVKHVKTYVNKLFSEILNGEGRTAYNVFKEVLGEELITWRKKE